MDSQDHNKPVTSTGHEVHGVHHCHRCGWPFPNPHPSAKHRRAHKRVCGKVEGYKIIQSDLVVSDDEQASDDDEHAPSPKVEKTKVKESGSSGGIGEKSNKSEDDVFSDAVTELSESGISPSLEERLEKGVDKRVGQKSVEGFVNTIQLKVDESAETTEQLNAPTTSGQTCNHGALVNAIDQSRSVIPINDTGTDAVSAGLSHRLQSDIIKSDSQKNVDIQIGDEMACVSLDSEEGKNSYPAVMAIERKDELCGKLDGRTSISSATNFTAVEDNSELEGVKVLVAKKYDASVIRAIGSEDVECFVSNVHAILSTGSFDPDDDEYTSSLKVEKTKMMESISSCRIVETWNKSVDVRLSDIRDFVKDPIAIQKERNSPARYPTEIKKEKKRRKPYWVPFVCCS